MECKDQVASAAKKVNKTLGMIKRYFKYINKDAFEVLYTILSSVPHMLLSEVSLLETCSIIASFGNYKL